MKIRVAICQVDMEWENTARNLKRLEPIVAAADADVVVLPEMFATGFKLRPACVAEPADGLVVTTMRRWAAQYGRAVVGSVVVAEQERFRNRMFFVNPSGETAWYDKRHLFRPGGEARDYSQRGSDQTAASLNGVLRRSGSEEILQGSKNGCVLIRKKVYGVGARRDGWSRPLPLGAPRPMIF